MRVHVTSEGGGGVRLDAAEECGSLSVRMSAVQLAEASDVLSAAGAGEVIGDHAWIEISWLRASAGDRDEAWHACFATMIDYAAGHGWRSADGRRLRAHIERRT